MSYQLGHETRFASENGLIGLNGVNSPCALPRTVSSLAFEENTPHLHRLCLQGILACAWIPPLLSPVVGLGPQYISGFMQTCVRRWSE